VLYMLASELRARDDARIRRDRCDEGPGKLGQIRANAFTMNVPEEKKIKFPGAKFEGKVYYTMETLREYFPLDNCGPDFRFFVRQRIPRSEEHMWLLLQEPHDQFVVEDDVLQLQVASEGEFPVTAKVKEDVWWLKGEPVKPKEEKSVPAPVNRKTSSEVSFNRQAMQETLQKTTIGVASKLGNFASWAKKGISAASSAMNTTETIRLPSRSVTVRKKIAEGGFSEVFLVHDDACGTPYALKRCVAHSREDLKDLNQEITLHKKVSSEYVMKLVDHTEEQSKKLSSAREIMIVFPLYSSGSLYDQMEDAVNNSTAWPFTEKSIIHFSIGILEGMKAIHRAGFVHRDIKPHNVLLGVPKGVDASTLRQNYKDVKPVLMDLGSCAPLKIPLKTRQEALMAIDEASVKCSAPYRAPELFEVPDLPFVLDEKCDVWSFGTTIYALTFGEMYSPFEHPTQGLQTLAILQGNVKFPSSTREPFSDQFKKIIKQMLQVDPAARPSIDKVLKGFQKLENL